MKHQKIKTRKNTDKRIWNIKGEKINICVFRILKAEGREHRVDIIFEEIKDKNFPELIILSGHRFKPKQVKYKEIHTWIHHSNTAINQR